MICKCGYENRADATYCEGCGGKPHRREGISKKWLAVAAVCLLVTGIGVGNLLSGLDHSAGEEEPQNSLQELIVKKDAEIAHVLPVEDGSVAVLYTDGTVRVSENSPFNGMVSGWSDVEQLYYNETYEWSGGEMLEYPTLYGLTTEGSVLCTDGKLYSWNNVKELHFNWPGVVGVTHDGRVLAEGEWDDVFFLTSLTDVEHLVCSDIQDLWGCLKKNGSAILYVDYGGCQSIHWNDIKELRCSGHAFYAIKNDGTVEGGVEDDQSGLDGAEKIVDFEDWLFGISPDGRLLTYNGGNIYTNAGDMVVDVPGQLCYGEEIDISQFDQVKDIVPFLGLVLLNKDGTVQFLGAYPEWDFRDWNDIQNVYGCYGKEWTVQNLYGIRKDGSVIMNQYDGATNCYTVLDSYRDWKLKDMYCVDGGVIGLTTDGKLVGDGIYENVDFSVFDG